jgi:hypothetical protein
MVTDITRLAAPEDHIAIVAFGQMVGIVDPELREPEARRVDYPDREKTPLAEDRVDFLAPRGAGARDTRLNAS